jgi:hypothetical protein
MYFWKAVIAQLVRAIFKGHTGFIQNSIQSRISSALFLKSRIQSFQTLQVTLFDFILALIFALF